MTKKTKPRVIFFDIETTPVENLRFQYDRSPYIKHDNIVKDWYIICAAWRELGSNVTKAVSIKKLGDDYNVVKTLRDALAGADIIAGHVIDRFDIRNLNSRLIYHKLPPLPPIPTIDTFKMSKKIGGFTSNKLDYLGEYFGLGKKIHVDGKLWRDVYAGSKTALTKMVQYNKRDVELNVDVYLRLRTYSNRHPHIGAIYGLDANCSCPKCGGTEFDPSHQKVRYTASGLPRIQKQCLSCFSYSTFKNDRNEMPNLPVTGDKSNRNRQHTKRRISVRG